jgi:catechol 2,3-dioxygenase-like lactoylglutathione lyase family enzyme
MSLAHRPVTSMLPVDDTDRAREFYSTTLGLPSAGTDLEGSPMYDLGGGGRLTLLLRPGQQHQHTALSFEVEDVAAELSELEGRGVRFEDYDMPGLTTVDHIASMEGEQAAWFLDPEGNVLCIHSAKG